MEALFNYYLQFTNLEFWTLNRVNILSIAYK